jgi:hypothetical protein
MQQINSQIKLYDLNRLITCWRYSYLINGLIPCWRRNNSVVNYLDCHANYKHVLFARKHNVLFPNDNDK